MPDNWDWQLSCTLVGAGKLTIGEAARAAGAPRHRAVYWCRRIDAPAARRFYFAESWTALELECLALSERDRAKLIIERGAGTPSNVAAQLGVSVRQVYPWIRGIDHKAARRAWCAALWAREMPLLQDRVADYRRREAEYYEYSRIGHPMPDGSIETEAQRRGIKHPDPEHGRYLWVGKQRVDTWAKK